MPWPRLAAVLLGTAFALLMPSIAHADFVVNTTSDVGDASPEGFCDSDGIAGAPFVCSLREAIEEANITPAPDTITFATMPFQGIAGTSTITTTGLPAITSPAHIDGGNCGTPSSVKPCVGIDSNSSANTALEIGSTATGSSVRGMAVFDSGIGVEVSASNATVTGSWFGLTLAEAVDGDAFGVLVARPGANVTVGGTTDATRNVFTGSTLAAIVLQGDDNFVRGNYIGIDRDGIAAPNAANILVGDTTVNPTGNVIGGTASANNQATAACDGPCNVISAAMGNGIDLDPPGLVKADETTISGNFIGLDAPGEVDLGNVYGVEVGAADDATIGGPTAGDRNFIGGNLNTGISATDPNADDLTVRNNFIGLSSDGEEAIPDGQRGVDINADGSTQDNRFGGTNTNPSGGALSMSSQHVASGNVIGLGTGGEDLGVPNFGILADSSGSVMTIGGTAAGAGNTIVNMRGAGSSAISIAGVLTTVTGNRIGVTSSGSARPNDGRGIRISDDAHQTTIGGPTPAAENVISNNTGGDAITLLDGGDSGLFDRNRGSGNGDQFIDLGDDGAGNEPPNVDNPNEGVQAPTVTSASTVAASGTVPDAGATVRVFRRAATFAGTVDAFVGQTMASGTSWSLTYPAAIPPGGQLVATQTPPSTMNTSELSANFGYTTAPVQSNPPAGGGGQTTVVTGVTAAQILAALKTDLRAVLKAAKKAGTAKLAKSVSVKGMDALVPGTIAARITANAPAGAAKRIVVISGKRTFAAAGKGTLKLKPTKKGRRLLRRVRRLKLSVALTFTPRGGKRTPASGKVTVKRKRKRR